MPNKIEIYKTSKGTEISVRLEEDTIWLDAHSIAKLFEVKRPAIVKHIGNIYNSEELEKESTCSILEQVAADKRKRKMNLYNLDMILSIGYRVNSSQATKFRQWATQRLKDYLVQGYAINEKRLQKKQQKVEYLKTGIRIVSRGIVTNMKEWGQFLDKFLALSDYPILLDKGKVSALEAKIKAETEYDKFRVIQDKQYISDFDEEVRKLIDKNTGGKNDEL